jgi:cellulose biosynthesis protein BcsQ
LFGIEDQPGRVVPTDVPRLWLLTNAVADAGANPAQVVAVQRAGIEQMRDHYDVIVLDTAPLLTTNDPIDVVSVADLVVLVVRAGQTRNEALRQGVEIMDNHRVPVAGVVLVGVTSVPNAYYYYYASDTARAARNAVKSASEARSASAQGAGHNGSSNGNGASLAAGNGDGGAASRNPDTLPN